MRLRVLAGLLYTCVLGAASLPAPALDPPQGEHKATAVFAGGCFWGVDAVFKHVQGVQQVVSGYAGGKQATAHYEMVGTGRTGHAESVQVTYDPTRVSYGKLLQVFFAVAHDPTQLNRQEYDVGTQYRSAIFYANEEQKRIAEAYIQQLDGAHAFKHKIVTQVTPLTGFFAAEGYHQNYLALHPDDAYIERQDMPKLGHLEKEFPELYQKK